MKEASPYILDYNAGNARSVAFALERLGHEPRIGNDVQAVRTASHVLFPGVGHAGPAIEFLRDNGLERALLERSAPTIGICLGMQLMCAHSEEGDVEGMGVFPETVKAFPEGGDEKVPHMGWNDVEGLEGPLFQGIPEQSCFYFVHGFYVEEGASRIARTQHIEGFASALAAPPFYGVQFHPERSGPYGEQLLKNFMAL